MRRVAIIMGSSSDWETMRHSAEVLASFGILYEARVVSAHRTPELMFEFARGAAEEGFTAIIAGAGGAAHLPGMVSSLTSLPVLAVPVQSRVLAGVDSLLSIVQMPAGIPTATFAIGPAGATNAALFAVRLLALHDSALRTQLAAYREDNAHRSTQSSKELVLTRERGTKSAKRRRTR
jgi:5-(carboxyamino)imidazole ribonucleotide mutase